MVGDDADNDGASAVLARNTAMGLIDDEELAYRKQSLKIHRMQKSFDNLFNYRPAQ